MQYKVDPCLQKHSYESFLDVTTFARRFVDRTIVGAVRTIADTTSKLPLPSSWPECTSELPEDGTLTCGTISSLKGMEHIEKLMKQWKSLPVIMNMRTTLSMEEWMYNVEFIGLRSDQSLYYYMYEAVWSVPTPEYPIPQVTASAYFTLAVDHLKPKSFPVDVTYKFEGSQFVHRPSIAFRQKWLYDILDMKTMLFKSFHF